MHANDALMRIAMTIAAMAFGVLALSYHNRNAPHPFIGPGNHFNIQASETEGGETAAFASDCSGVLAVGASDTVIIDGDEIYASLDIAGKLIIAGGRLTICGTGPSVVAHGGCVEIGDGDVSGTLVFAASHTVQGGGRISGEHANSAICIVKPASGSRTLTSKLVIQGTLTMKASGTGAGSAVFNNARTSIFEEGVILANGDGPFVFDESLIVDDSALVLLRPAYIVAGGSSTLSFERASDGSSGHPRLEGRFDGDGCGVLEFLATVQTYGPLDTADDVMVFAVGSPVFTFNYGSLGEVTINIDCKEYGACDCTP